jgi:cell division septum initiation protein DivIVA
MKATSSLVKDNEKLRAENARLRAMLKTAAHEAAELMARLHVTEQHLEATAQSRAVFAGRIEQLEQLVGGGG